MSEYISEYALDNTTQHVSHISKRESPEVVFYYRVSQLHPPRIWGISKLDPISIQHSLVFHGETNGIVVPHFRNPRVISFWATSHCIIVYVYIYIPIISMIVGLHIPLYPILYMPMILLLLLLLLLSLLLLLLLLFIIIIVIVIIYYYIYIIYIYIYVSTIIYIYTHTHIHPLYHSSHTFPVS